ncbi:hypothetical protein GT037_006470, partial [Alternaria burnsii]
LCTTLLLPLSILSPTHSSLRIRTHHTPLLIVAPMAYAKAWLADIHTTGGELEPPGPAPKTHLAYPPTLKQHMLCTSKMTTCWLSGTDLPNRVATASTLCISSCNVA